MTKTQRKRRSGIFKRNKSLVFHMNAAVYGKLTCECCKLAPLRRNLAGETIMTSVTATVDHIIDLCQGGTHELNNLQVLCFDCNNKKSNS